MITLFFFMLAPFVGFGVLMHTESVEAAKWATLFCAIVMPLFVEFGTAASKDPL